MAVIVKPAAWHRFGLLPFQRQFVRDLVDQGNVWLAAMGSPLVLAEFQDVKAGICVYSDVEPLHESICTLSFGTPKRIQKQDPTIPTYP